MSPNDPFADEASATHQAISEFFSQHTEMDQLLPAVYDRLNVLARSARRRVDQASTLNTTALVNEAYLKLREVKGLRTGDRNEFFALCARVMRHILIDHARRRSAGKRQAVEDPLVELQSADRFTTLLGLDSALVALAERHPRLADVVECRFFAGYTQEETAEILGLSDRTLRRDWLKAKALLIKSLDRQ